MPDDRWNDDVAYAFDTHKMFMNAMGLWPLQKMTAFTIMRWSLLTILLVRNRAERERRVTQHRGEVKKL
ncbi:hypothetical protein EAI_00735 [Harpegnathos saltator]|uniref:Uncharacterized protein n=1 Tax=Harpegnathos saltator TaxID=610380 RepID=E2B442_HARSA|nr:hypothetical protein EAI_00735 [Harpegnathos saltator]